MKLKTRDRIKAFLFRIFKIYNKPIIPPPCPSSSRALYKNSKGKMVGWYNLTKKEKKYYWTTFKNKRG